MRVFLGVSILSSAILGLVQAQDGALPAYPTVRFTPWESLPEQARNQAKKIGYRDTSWNQPGSWKEVEGLDFDSLPTEVSHAVTALGVGGEQWDCYVNHYRNYDWEELTPQQEADYGLLGWTREDWDDADDDQAETEVERDDYWTDLSEPQRKAASRLCYTPELWDEVAIPEWESAPSVSSASSAASSNGFEGPHALLEHKNRRGIPVPHFRYQPWSALNTNLQFSARQAGYDEGAWNRLGSLGLEQMDLETIGQDMEAEVLQAIRAIGFKGEDQWDCYVSHYQTYEWYELGDAGVLQFVKTLGYSEEMWNDNIDPDSFDLDWAELTPAEKEAAYQLGYFQEVWDEVGMEAWPAASNQEQIVQEPATSTSTGTSDDAATATATASTTPATQAASSGGNRLVVFLAILLACLLLTGAIYAALKHGLIQQMDAYLAAQLGKKESSDLEMLYGGADGRYTDSPGGKNIQLYDDSKEPLPPPIC